MIRSRTNTSRIAQRSQQIKTIIQNKPTKKSNIKTNILLSTRIENLKQATTKNNNNKQHTQVNKKENTNVEAPNQKQHKTTSNENTATKHKSNNTTQHNKQE